MVDAEWMRTEVQKVYAEAVIECVDFTGNGDHWFVKVISDSFEGMRPLARQRPILKHFQPFIASNVVHALDLKCWTSEQAAARPDEGEFHPHQQDDFVGIHIRRPKNN